MYPNCLTFPYLIVSSLCLPNAGIVKKEKGSDQKILGTGLDVKSLYLQKNKYIKCQMPL